MTKPRVEFPPGIEGLVGPDPETRCDAHDNGREIPGFLKDKLLIMTFWELIRPRTPAKERKNKDLLEHKDGKVGSRLMKGLDIRASGAC